MDETTKKMLVLHVFELCGYVTKAACDDVIAINKIEMAFSDATETDKKKGQEFIDELTKLKDKCVI